MEPSGKTLSLLSHLPSFYEADNPESLLFQLLAVFGQSIEEAEEDLRRVMRSHYVLTADNEGSRGIGSGTENLGDLDSIFALYLETLGGTSLLMPAHFQNKAESLHYRDRLLALIRELRQGAATKDNILDIVAVNLGIFSDDRSDDEAANAAKAPIRIEEYLPKLAMYPFTIHPVSAEPSRPTTTELNLAQSFSLTNPNVFPTAFSFEITLRDLRRTTAQLLQPLNNPTLVNLDNGDRFEFKGMLPVGLEHTLRVLPSGQLLIKGVENAASVIPPQLPVGTSRWQLDATVGEALGRFDETIFDYAYFAQDEGIAEVEKESVRLNRQQVKNYAIDLKVELTQLTPGAFRVIVPWHIPGFTDKFTELPDHPRTQIPAIIDKVKAAGVLVTIDYEQKWTEQQDIIDRLTVLRSPFAEFHAIEEGDFDMGSYQLPYPQGIQHEISDQLILSGVFDYTAFDSGNKFA